MDRITKAQRSYIMSRIRSKNTKIELTVFRELRRRGIHFQKHYKRVPGCPDVAMPARKIAIFIDGDFWHGYRYPAWRAILPSDFWRSKIERNRARDVRNFRRLRYRGWKVLRVWGHELIKDEEETMKRILRFAK